MYVIQQILPTNPAVYRESTIRKRSRRTAHRQHFVHIAAEEQNDAVVPGIDRLEGVSLDKEIIFDAAIVN